MDPLVNHTKIQNRTNTTSSDTLPKNRRGSNISQFPNSFFEASITLISKLDKDTTPKNIIDQYLW